MRLCVSHPNEIVFMNFTKCRVFLCILGGIWPDCGCGVYFKSGPTYRPEPGYRQRDSKGKLYYNHG